ncbi:PepSY domain-containing protein [Pararhodobacter zhoushanensis]|uniref:PepSY domain-containing protein n=1 Tax=Pararhodobacter zhoushanensis TaxID=2479545 RepID=A0ABT3H085_9RHOB|nr:PepSY domain-containing protein [Pararhodobacter zhoushanensis]MCW1933197.1 PepSY domain-containing protein [Pararhodobacter zhoushanensis]
MITRFKPAAAALILTASFALPLPAQAWSWPAFPDSGVDTETQARIVASLEPQGYQVFTVERERGGYEVKAEREGRLWELRLNADLTVTRSELDD